MSNVLSEWIFCTTPRHRFLRPGWSCLYTAFTLLPRANGRDCPSSETRLMPDASLRRERFATCVLVGSASLGTFAGTATAPFAPRPRESLIPYGPDISISCKYASPHLVYLHLHCTLFFVCTSAWVEPLVQSFAIFNCCSWLPAVVLVAIAFPMNLEWLLGSRRFALRNDGLHFKFWGLGLMLGRNA